MSYCHPGSIVLAVYLESQEQSPSKEKDSSRNEMVTDCVPTDVALEDACIKQQVITPESGMVVVYISHLISPSQFFIQCEDETKKLDILMNEIKYVAIALSRRIRQYYSKCMIFFV